jgi:mono/diheme cytochrome c family protein
VLSYPLHGNMGDQDPPAWWWLSHKTRYLWFGGHSTDSARGNMYFGSVNALSGDQVKENEGIFEDVHQWTLTVEAPGYPQGYCSGGSGAPAPGDAPGCINRGLAEQGAILFHEKDLWADGENADIPRPKGNGACAGCHGAYSPRYVNDTRFLPTPRLAGTVGYTVPIEIIDTDPAQAEGWAREIREHVSTFWWSYPDAVEGYRLPEEKDPLTEVLDDYVFLGASGSDLADHLGRNLSRMGALQPLGTGLSSALTPLLSQVSELPLNEFAGRVKGACGFEEKTVGYVTPPLHGVWASAPYFHNGSVPDLWGVLKPEARPKVWRRQRTTTPVHFNAFEARLSGYDFERLGWKHEVLACDDGAQGIPYYQCQPSTDAPVELQWFADTVLGGLLWPTWLVPPPIGEQGLADRMIFNTNMYSKKNRGHAWTRTLTDTERRALLEYLKTL